MKIGPMIVVAICSFAASAAIGVQLGMAAQFMALPLFVLFGLIVGRWTA